MTFTKLKNTIFLILILLYLSPFCFAATTFNIGPGEDRSGNLSEEASLITTFYSILTTWIAPMMAACMIYSGIIRCSKKQMSDGMFLIVCGVLMLFIKTIMSQLSTLMAGS